MHTCFTHFQMESRDPVKCSCQNTCSRATKRNQCRCLKKGQSARTNLCQCGYGNVPCSNKHCVNSGDDLPVLQQTDDADTAFDNNNYGADVSYVVIL